VAELRFFMKAGSIVETITSTHYDLVLILKFFIIVVGINFHARNILYTNMLKVALTNLNHMFVRQSAIEKYHMGHHLNKHFK